MFINDYYVANKNANKYFLDYLTNKNLEEFLNFEYRYKVDNSINKLIVSYELNDKNNEKMAYLLLFKDLSDIKIPIISTIRQVFVFSIFIIILFVLLLILFMENEKNTKRLKLLNKQNLIKINELELQKEKTNKIFNSQPTITIITDGKTIHDANKRFFTFFSDFEDINSFTKTHECICDFFEKTDIDNYIYEKTINGISWVEYILNNPNNTFKVIMKKEEQRHHFIIIASRTVHIEKNKKDLIVVSFLDITQEVQLNDDLRKKDKLLMQQSKLASMGEMMGNIAHQWRQPLSVISTSASLLSIKDQYAELKEEDEEKYINSILQSTEYLSKTIDDFKDYFKPEKKLKEFDISKTIEKSLFLISVNLKKHDIDVVKELESITVKSFENELIQILMNVLTNAKDALKNNNTIERKIFIEVFKSEKNLNLIIKDNAGGIDKDIIERIFEPYFTTKHQSKGTGIGLYMVEQMVTKHMNGTIDVKNDTFTFENKVYNGAKFIIKFPLYYFSS